MLTVPVWICISESHLSQSGQTGGRLRMAHVGLGGADEQRLSLGLTEHTGDAIHLLRIPDLQMKNRHVTVSAGLQLQGVLQVDLNAFNMMTATSKT